MTELSPEETESITGGYGKSISHVIIGLKTVKGTKQLKLDPTIYDSLIKEKVSSCYLFAFSCTVIHLFFCWASSVLETSIVSLGLILI